MIPKDVVPSAAVFVGRERERALIDDALDSLLANHGGLILIAGDAGVGKTALVSAAVCRAEASGAHTLMGRCYDTVPPPPYSVWLDLFQRYDTVTRTIPPPAPFVAGGGLQGIANPAALTNQLWAWLEVLAANGPLVLVLEDLHWADPASLDLLRTLARSLSALPVLILATYREDALDREHPLYLLLPHIARESDAMRITLLPLREAEIRRLVDMRYPMSPPEAARLTNYVYARAEGNAFFTTELLRALEEYGTLRYTTAEWQIGDLAHAPIPSLLRQMIDERIARLGSEAYALLEVAAAIGQEVPLALWMQASGREERAVLAVAEAAITAHLFQQGTGSTLRFVHALTRDALVAGLPLLRGRQVHRQIAEALIGQAHVDPGIVASHLQVAGDARALTWLLRAADRAEQASAFKSATDYLQAALPLLANAPEGNTRRVEVLLRIAGLVRYAPWTVPYAREALQIAQEIGDAPLVAIAELRLSFATMLAMLDLRPMLTVQRNALAVLENLPPAALADLARVDATAASLPASRQAHAELISSTGDSIEVFRLLDMPATHPYHAHAFEDGCAYIALGITYTGMGRIRDARAAFVDGVAWFTRLEQLGSTGALYEWELNELTLVCETDDRVRRDILAARAEHYYAQDPMMEGVFPPRYARARLLTLEGAWDEALALLLDVRDRIGFLGWVGYHSHTIAWLFAARGDVEHAREMIRTVFAEGHATPPGSLYLQNALRTQRLAATIALDAGDPDTAQLWLTAHDRWVAWCGATLGQADGAIAWAMYYRAVKALDRAAEEADRALALATTPRQPLALLAAHRLYGELATDAGSFDRAASHLAIAETLAEGCNAPYERALILIARAILARATDAQEDAERMLEDARIIANRLGARPTLDRIVALIADTPVPTPQSPRPRGLRLTEREQEVLTLIAQGETNSGIGKTLALSTRTVDRHIANIYSKIGAHNRADAITFALRANLGQRTRQ